MAKRIAAPVPHSPENFASVLQSQGLVEALRVLNRKVPHRFTGVFLFDPPTLVNHALVDSWDTSAYPLGEMPIEQTFCGRVDVTGEAFTTNSAAVDPRLAGHHLARNTVQSYCGVVLRDPDGEIRGTLCHWDLKPCDFAATAEQELEEAARHLAQISLV